jgi:hypothetical protein
MRVPKDQGLFLTVFITVCVAVILGMWLAMPMHRTVVIEGEETEEQATPEPLTLEPAVTPEERIQKMAQALSMAEAAVADMEETGSKEAGSKKKGSSP